jgi:hypothetical protein
VLCARRQGCGLDICISMVGKSCIIDINRRTLSEKTWCAGGEVHELADGRRARQAHWAQERHEGGDGGHVGYMARDAMSGVVNGRKESGGGDKFGRLSPKLEVPLRVSSSPVCLLPQLLLDLRV